MNVSCLPLSTRREEFSFGRCAAILSDAEPYAPRPESLSWPISATIITQAGTFLVSHVVGHDPRFITGIYR